MANSHMQTIVTIYNHMEWHATLCKHINPLCTIWLHMKQTYSAVRNHMQLLSNTIEPYANIKNYIQQYEALYYPMENEFIVSYI